MPPRPCPLPYHRAVVEHLRTSEPGLWSWFASSRKRAAESDAVRLDLLKSTYRLDPASQPKLHEHVEAIRQRMHLSCSITLYQSQTGSDLNAALAYLPSEAHIILSGPLASMLSENEVEAVLAHELGHFQLFEDGEGEYLVAADLLRALAVDSAAGNAASESARLYNLWTEIFADRWACHTGGDAAAAIAALLKTSTGLAEVNAESYLRQAEEIFAKSSEKTDHVSHPEPYIRARALRLWVEKGDDAQADIDRMIQGGISLQRLDLLGQKRAADLTRRFLQALVAPAWFRSEPVLAHASRFFADFTIDAEPVDCDSLKRDLDAGDASLRDYVCYLMLDFITVDRELGDPAISAAIVLARRLGIEKRFAELVQKELALGKKAFAKIDRDAETILAKTDSAYQP
jgi:Zn-dependent protease with chaperone function